jgi:ComF family protein
MVDSNTSGMRRWWERAVGLVYPRNCRLCAVPLDESEPGVVCSACLRQAKLIEPPFCQRCALPFAGAITDAFTCGYCAKLEFRFDRAVSACRAEGVVRDCIHRFKYNRELYFGRHLSDWMMVAARRWIDWTVVDALVPVPLHPRKQRHREFNQAEVLARAVSRELDKPVLRGQLRRVKDTETQTHLGAAARVANLRGAFAVRQAASVAGRRLVLVDDVFTTGATLDSCAKVLRHAGAVQVTALTVARGV